MDNEKRKELLNRMSRKLTLLEKAKELQIQLSYINSELERVQKEIQIIDKEVNEIV